MHQYEIEIHGQADCPQDRAQGEVDGKERLCNAQVLHCSAWIPYVHNGFVIGGVVANIIKPVKIHQVPDQVSRTHSEVHDGEVHEDPARFAAHVPEAGVGEDDEEAADHGEEAGGAHHQPHRPAFGEELVVGEVAYRKVGHGSGRDFVDQTHPQSRVRYKYGRGYSTAEKWVELVTCSLPVCDMGGAIQSGWS